VNGLLVALILIGSGVILALALRGIVMLWRADRADRRQEEKYAEEWRNRFPRGNP
jgi:type II secretory pathway component PulL